MDSGEAALLGALIGGVLTAGSNIWLERARAHRDRARERAHLARELRTAARLVFAELAHSAATIVTAQQNGVWTETDRKDLKHNRWREHQQALAGHLPDEDWEAVEHAYELLYLVYQHRPVSDADRMPTELYDRTLSVLESARPALTAYARTISPADGE